ncbi:hydrogenase expression/formation protein HypE [Salipaludibacillus keqinensis]|uniref:Hydrogenase expression/formation protein HypE n=1 Tax=Salipaludibacillus keqinensis TaxID=2045207 RepID=A0A323TJN5_9BACI|nr:hydrogenase expression/formation protein HypE [Salipaludibacillus keqinensis]PYZ95342.1 hydrogenase expression/formation protein HypE [Salipaludibacillus keqinensis]
MERISLGHGEGGELTHQLIHDVFIRSFDHGEQARLDAAIISSSSEQIAVSTDSYVVDPIFFPGGDIGKLAITGTVNDLAVTGAVPKVITAAFMIEEGFPIRDLKHIVKSMAQEAEKAEVKIIAGDTKVVERGSVDGIFITTTGIGAIEQSYLNPESMKKGDAVIINGTIGDHGIAILSARKQLGLMTNVTSDCASLNQLIQNILRRTKGIRAMRDLTRGGLATGLVELCEDFNSTMEIEEAALPIRDEVKGACEILGFDPVYLANEGKTVIIVDANEADLVLDILHKDEYGADACLIGHVTAVTEQTGKLKLKTPVNTTRRLSRLSGMVLPRIC